MQLDILSEVGCIFKKFVYTSIQNTGSTNGGGLGWDYLCAWPLADRGREQSLIFAVWLCCDKN